MDSKYHLTPSWIQSEKTIRTRNPIFDEKNPITKIRISYLTPKGKECYYDFFIPNKRPLKMWDLAMALKRCEDHFGFDLNLEYEVDELINEITEEEDTP